MFSHSILLEHSPSERQFVDDLTNLCKRHKISCGNTQDITHLGADLVSNDSFRIDLFTLCTANSHMAEADLSPEQLLVLVVCAFGGSETSIRDATVDLPQDVMCAFLDGYETWLRRELDPDACSPQRANRDQNPVSSPPGPTLFYTAASRSGADPRGTRDGAPASRAANSAPSRHHIPANTPLESLTLSELRMYLEDIENRVSRLEPRLERIAPERFSSPEHIEQPEALDAQRVPEASSIVVAEPAIVPETIVPATQAELALDATTSSPLVVPHQDAIVSNIFSSATDAAHLRRLRIVNAVLTFLLILVCGSAAIFGYRYLRPQPVPIADASHRSPLPFAQLPSNPSPADQATKALKHRPPPSAAASIPTSIHHSGKTTSGNVVDTHPPHVSPTLPTATPASVVPLAPRADIKSPKPSPTPAIEAHAPAHSNLPAVVPTTPDNQDHSQARLSPSVAQPDRNSTDPERPSPPAATRPLVSSATPAPTRPADTSAPASIPHPAKPTNAPVVVPAAMMMTYAVSTPKPVYPRSRFIGVESAIDVEATISKDGKVTSARALNGALDVRGPAVRAVQDWRFKPYILDGNPVAVVTTFKFVFKAH